MGLSYFYYESHTWKDGLNIETGPAKINRYINTCTSLSWQNRFSVTLNHHPSRLIMLHIVKATVDVYKMHNKTDYALLATSASITNIRPKQLLNVVNILWKFVWMTSMSMACDTVLWYSAAVRNEIQMVDFEYVYSGKSQDPACAYRQRCITYVNSQDNADKHLNVPSPSLSVHLFTWVRA